MFNPYRILKLAFEDEYRVSLGPARPDGSRRLVLCGRGRRLIKRRLTANELADPVALLRRIRSIRFGIAIDRGQALLWLAEQVSVDGADRNACPVSDPARRPAGRRP